MKGFLVGFRKFIAFAVYFFVALILLVTDVIPSDTWLTEVTKVAVAFMGTNIGEHLINLGREWIANKKIGDVAEILKRGSDS